MTKQPKDMLIVGSGPIGCELGQGFQRLGSNVTMLEVFDSFLPRDDASSVKFLQDQLIEDGITFKFNAQPVSFTPEGDKIKTVIK